MRTPNASMVLNKDYDFYKGSLFLTRLDGSVVSLDGVMGVTSWLDDEGPGIRVEFNYARPSEIHYIKA